MALPSIVPTVRPELFLKQFAKKDARALFALIEQNRDHLSQFDDETSTKYPDLQSVKRSIANPTNPSRIRYGIWQKEMLVGSINVTPVEDYPMYLEIGYWIGKAYCRNGIATLATRTLVEAIRLSEKITHVVAWTHEKNRMSQRVLLKAGLELSGHFKNNAWFSLKIQ